jgi:hypothetical protein
LREVSAYIRNALFAGLKFPFFSPDDILPERADMLKLYEDIIRQESHKGTKITKSTKKRRKGEKEGRERPLKPLFFLCDLCVLSDLCENISFVKAFRKAKKKPSGFFRTAVFKLGNQLETVT